MSYSTISPRTLWQQQKYKYPWLGIIALKVLLSQPKAKQDFLRRQNVTVNFHELKTHCEIAAATPTLSESGVTPWIRYVINVVAIVATCQLQHSHTLKHMLLYHLFYSKWDHDLQNEHHAVLKKTNTL